MNYSLSCLLNSFTNSANSTILLDFGDDDKRIYDESIYTLNLKKKYYVTGKFFAFAYYLYRPILIDQQNISGNDIC